MHIALCGNGMDRFMKIMFVGDINLGEYYTAFGHGPLSYALKNNRSVFERVKSILDRADFVVGNLEAPITSHNDDPEEPERCVLKAHPDVAYQLKDAGFNLLQVANNHTVQHGVEGFKDTLDTLDAMGIAHVGVREQNAEIFHFGGQSFAFFAASDVPDNTDKEQVQYQQIDELFLDRVQRSVQQYDHVIVMLHWGLESAMEPLPYQRDLCARLKSSGVRAIIGSHPHVFYEVEVDRNFVCAYSLGDFVFDLYWDWRLLRSGILEINFLENDLKATVWPVSLESLGCIPTQAGDPIHIESSRAIYDLGDRLAWRQTKKMAHFWLNIFRGNTRLKLRFFSRKIFRRLGMYSGAPS